MLNIHLKVFLKQMNQCDINLLNTCTKTATTSTLYDLINAKNDEKKKRGKHSEAPTSNCADVRLIWKHAIYIPVADPWENMSSR